MRYYAYRNWKSFSIYSCAKAGCNRQPVITKFQENGHVLKFRMLLHSSAYIDSLSRWNTIRVFAKFRSARESLKKKSVDEIDRDRSSGRSSVEMEKFIRDVLEFLDFFERVRGRASWSSINRTLRVHQRNQRNWSVSNYTDWASEQVGFRWRFE